MKKIFYFDIIIVLISIFFIPVRSEVMIYNFSDSVNNKAFQKLTDDIAVPPPWTNGWDGNEVDSSCYTNISQSDDIRCDIFSQSNNMEPWIRLNFTINQSKNNIEWLYIRMEGIRYGGANEFCAVIQANFTNSQWFRIGNDITATASPDQEIIINYTNTNEIQRIIDSNKQLVLLAEGINSDNREGCSLDFVEVKVGYTVRPPVFSNNATNDTEIFEGDDIKHSVKWSDDDGLSYYFFEWNNTAGCSGGFSNASEGILSGTSDWSNISQNIPSGCSGKTIWWRVYANDSYNKWNVTPFQIYNVYKYGILSVNLTYPDTDIYTESNPLNVDQNNIFTINTTIKCDGGPGATCGSVIGSVRYGYTNITTLVNTTKGDKPFYIIHPLSYGNETEEKLPTFAINSSNNEITFLINKSDDIYGEEYCNCLGEGCSCTSNYSYVNFTVSSTYDNITIEWSVFSGNEGEGFFECFSTPFWIILASTTDTIDKNVTKSLSNCKINNGNYSFRYYIDASDYNLDGSASDYIKVDMISINRTTGGYGKNSLSCGSLFENNICQLNWTINTTGDLQTLWKIDVNFTSSYTQIQENNTKDVFICIGGNCIQTNNTQLSFIDDNNSLIGTIKIINESGIIASGNGHIFVNLTLNRNYTIEFLENITTQNLLVRIIDLNITEGINITSQIVKSYSKNMPQSIRNVTSIFAMNDTNLNYSYATLFIPKEGIKVDKIIHCTNWNFSSSNCNSWEINNTSDYYLEENSTHIWFNVSHFQGFGGGESSYLEVQLILPPLILDISQNQTFTVNATVFCRGGGCDNVTAMIKYNGSSSNPDTLVNTTYGDKPFYIQESPSLAIKECPTNPLNDTDEFCNITWKINATGDIGSVWKLGAHFNSSNPFIKDNHTLNSSVSIFECMIDIRLNWNFIIFPDLFPNTKGNAAPGNDNKLYNITIDSSSCQLNLWIKGSDLENATLGTKIGVSNLTWNTQNSYSTATKMTKLFSLLSSNVQPGTNVTTYYWLDVPSIYAGKYNGTVTILGNLTQ